MDIKIAAFLRFAVRISFALTLCVPALAQTPLAVPSAAKAVHAAEFGARGDGISDDTKQLQQALDSGRVVYLAPGRTYAVTSRLEIPSEGGMLGDGTATIFARASGFTNSDPTIKGRYGSTSAVISASGMTRPPFTPHKDIVIRGIKLRFEPTEGRHVDAIVARNVHALTIEGVEISGFPAGTGVRVATISGRSSISNNRIHDFRSNTDFSKSYPGAGPQITAIEVDNDRVNGVASKGLVIAGNEIANITVGPTFLSAHGYQTDGINIAHWDSSEFRIEGNRIRYTGEGIDVFGSAGIITGNVISDSYLFGIKLVHGASGNQITRNEITRSGLAGIALAGSASATQGTEKNVVSNNVVRDIDPAGVWAANETSCIQLSDNRGTVHKVRNNVFSGNVLDPGRNGKWSVNVANSSGGNNSLLENVFVAKGSRGMISKGDTPTAR